MANIITELHDINKANQDAGFSQDIFNEKHQKQINKNDKLDHNEKEQVRYMKMTIDFKTYYTELTPGVEKPPNAEYVGRHEFLENLAIQTMGIEAYLKFYNTFRRSKKADQHLELQEVIRKDPKIESKLLK